MQASARAGDGAYVGKEERENTMQLKLVYKSGNTYWEPWPSDFKIQVERKANNVQIHFRSNEGKQTARLVLTLDVAERLGRALLLSTSGDVGPILLPIAEKAAGGV